MSLTGPVIDIKYAVHFEKCVVWLLASKIVKTTHFCEKNENSAHHFRKFYFLLFLVHIEAILSASILGGPRSISDPRQSLQYSVDFPVGNYGTCYLFPRNSAVFRSRHR